MATLKLPHKNPKIIDMGWTKEQGEKVAQKIREYGYIEVYELRERYGDNMIDEVIIYIYSLLQTWTNVER